MKAFARIIARPGYSRSNGEIPLYLEVKIEQKRKWYSLSTWLQKNEWDNKAGRVKPANRYHQELNYQFSKSIQKANDIFYHYSMNETLLSFQDFEDRFFNKIYSGKSFYEFAEHEIKGMHEYSQGTIKGYYTLVSKMRQFKPNLGFQEINLNFIKSYDDYMRKELGNNQNTIHRSHRFIRSIINRAIRQDIIKENPYKRFTLKLVPTHRQFLTISELETLASIQPNISGSLKEVLRHFLFSCYTGLRYSDLFSLQYKNINEGMIKITMHKTKDQVSIPLCDAAKKLIDFSDHFPDEPVFLLQTNQPLNKRLKEIMEIAGINKNISFHCARHTFATVGISLGIPLEVVSKLLGHRDLKTTSIYAQIVDDVKIAEMKKFNSLIGTS